MPKTPRSSPPVSQSQSDEDEPLDRPPTPTPAPKPASAETPKPTVVKSSSSAGKKPLPKWLWMAVAGAAVLIVAGVVGWKIFGGTSSPTVNSNPAADAANEILVARLLDGVPVLAEKSNSNIYAIVIENIVESRPPSALDKASVVYETLAEGGITRFLTLYPVGDSISQIGPVRSARPYFISWAEEYKPLFVHAGGSPQAIDYLRSGKANVYDFNQFSHGGNFIRDDTRPAPHNLYTDSDKLFMGLRRTAPDATPTYTSWTFKDEAPIDARPTTVNDVVIDFSSFNYKVTYAYDRVQNRYQRLVAEKPHLTRENNQIYAKDVVVEFAKIGLVAGDKQRLDIQTVGSGKLLLFRDGTVTEGTWKKDSPTARTQFLDTGGNPLALNPGPIWIEVVPTDRKVTY